jgi:hypothetical protein
MGAREARKARSRHGLFGQLSSSNRARELLGCLGVWDGQHPEGARQRNPSEGQPQQMRKVGLSAQCMLNGPSGHFDHG